MVLVLQSIRLKVHFKQLGRSRGIPFYKLSTAVGKRTLMTSNLPDATDPAEPVNNHSDVVDSKFDVITEGAASIRFPKGNQVFYNPIQQYNRDISTVGIRAWQEFYNDVRITKRSNKRKRNSDDSEKAGEQSGNHDKANTDAIHSETPASDRPYVEIIEALSASGLRAIRYAKEIPSVRKVFANDFSASAVDSIRKNVEFNSIEAKVVPNQGDANMFMYTRKSHQVHVVDLDPYGSATPFIDAAIQAVTDGGLLLVTCTDLGVLAGNGYPEKCFAQYGGMPLYSDATHESALRLVLQMIATAAGKQGRAIEPLLSLSIDFYVRLFIRVKNSPAQVKFNASKTMLVYNCSRCGTTTNQPLGRATAKGSGYKFGYAQGPTVSENCTHCGSIHHLAGPMWGDKIHDRKFIEKMLEIHDTLDPNIYGTLPRMKGMLTLALQELEDSPFYVLLANLSSIVRTSCPPFTKFASALLNSGYQVSMTHAKAGALKTNAPYSVLWDVLRAWISTQHEGKISDNLKPGAPGAKILSSLETANPISFEDHPKAVELEVLRKSKLVRFQTNPTENWGPKSKASTN